MNQESNISQRSQLNPKNKISFEALLVRYLLIAALIPTCLLASVFWYFGLSVYLSSLILLVLCLLIGFCAYSLHQVSSYKLRSLANLLTAISEGDYSLRGINKQDTGALSELSIQINNLSDTLAEHRFIAHESQLLVTKVIQHIDVAIIAIDQNKQIALLNPAAEKLLVTSQEKALGKPLADFNASELLSVEQQQLVKLSFAPQQGNYQVIHDHYHEQGQQHNLYFITNVHGLLRENERQSWQNLIRVISHEINNSLAPIASLANTLTSQAKKQNLADMYADNLSIISTRAKGLKDFIGSYRQLNFMPELKKSTVNISDVLVKLQPLFPNRLIKITCDVNTSLSIDVVQIEQVLINLLKNADEAMEEVASKDLAQQTNTIMIDVKKVAAEPSILIKIVDQGIGINNSDNLFTPFYSTKKQGSGIGLLLSRQIIEAHDGSLSLNNREDVQGCIVELKLPIP